MATFNTDFGVGSLGSSLIGGLLGWFGQKKTNEMNMRINQMNNEFNERMLDKQLAFQEDMWNKTNAYNDPSSQRRRLVNAGLNPYMMLSGGNAGTATAMNGGSASAASPLAMQNPASAALQGAGTVGNLFTSAALARAEVMNKDANTVGTIIDNDYRAEMNRANLSEIYARTKNWHAQYRLNGISAEFQERNMDNALLQTDLQNQHIRAQIRQTNAVTALTGLQAREKQILNSYLDQQQQLDMAERVARIVNLGQMTKESQAKIRLMAQQEVVASLQASGMRVQNEVANTIADSLTSSIIMENIFKSDYYGTYSGSARARQDKDLMDNNINLGVLNIANQRTRNKRHEKTWWIPNTPFGGYW